VSQSGSGAGGVVGDLVRASDTAPIVSGCTSIAAARQPARLAIARTAGSAATTRIQECVTRSADQ
jgi:hypothetical protein